ncbi:MAG TPA: phosphotransferase family protein [Bryobacteraceae bacterium]
MLPDTAPVRPGEELDRARLAAYLEGKIDGAADGIEIEQFPGGHSNLTYCLRTGGKEYVLRRAPLGPVAPKAHDMAREARILEAVSPFFPQAPKPYLVCEDPTILGAVFFLMERRRGIILRHGVPESVASQPDYAPRISEAFMNCFAALHSIDVEKNGLLVLGKPEGFVERQVKGWSERWIRAKTEPMPEADEVMSWLAAHIPPSGPPTLVHNDYKLDNVMLPLDSIDRVEAVLDWEMTTVGDPMIDVGLTLCYWTHATNPKVSGGGVPSFTSGPGWFTRDQFIAAYTEKTGRSVETLGYHEVLGVFKLAVILQQIYYRFWKGQTSDERFRHFDQRVRALIEIAHGLVSKHA